MGKSVPKGIKSKANIILKEMPESFNDTFENNKTKIKELKLPFSKWTTNVMAGFMTRHHKKIKKAEKKKEEAKAKREIAMKKPEEMGKERKIRTRTKKEEKTAEGTAVTETLTATNLPTETA